MITTQLAPARLPAGRRVYAIGDVHGCADLLAALHARIAEDLAARPIAAATVLHLGDLIDRGPDSAGVIEALLGPWRGAGPEPERITLRGNHEELMLAALDGGDRDSRELWLVNGGVEALASWRLPHRSVAADWRTAIPADHVAFMRGLRLLHWVGGYVFVHAGLRPGVPIALQDRDDLVWIREPFLSSDAIHPGVVVHGHTPVPEPTLRANRIGIDTGAVLGGRLTCAVLEADQIGFISAS